MPSAKRQDRDHGDRRRLHAPLRDRMPGDSLGIAAVAMHHRSNLRFWLNRGVDDGHRLDAVGLPSENGPTARENQRQTSSLMAERRR